MGQQSDQLGRYDEGKRDHEQRAETGEQSQWVRRVDFAWIVSVETEIRRLFISAPCCTVPQQIAHTLVSISSFSEGI
jgi:hypothetical protein